MKVLISKQHDGERSITVVPRWEARMAPIQVRGGDELILVAELLAVIREVGDRERSPPLAAP